MTDLGFMTIHEAASLLQLQAISPVELVQACLARIQRVEPTINSFITITDDLALVQARQAEVEIQRGNIRGPLHGIPLALKDLFDTAGVRTTAGSTFFADYVPGEDAHLVQRLKASGAVLLGKLNMHEIALGVTNENPHYGACHNPWDTRRISGGSSGGSAAALAAGLCLGSLGSDTGGSIRIPAALCGVVGLKPTFGRCSLRGVLPLSWNLDHAGPLARSVRDVALLLHAMAGYDAEDPYSARVPVPDYIAGMEAGVRGWRMAMVTGDFVNSPDPRILEALAQAAKTFESLGAVVEPVVVDDLSNAAQANGLMVVSDAAAFHQERLVTRPLDFGSDVLKRLQAGAAYSSTDYVLARRTQSLARRQMTRLFESYNLLLLPATSVVAPKLGTADAVERAPQLTRFTAPFNLTGLPALSLPCGFVQEDGSSLPVGLQIVAPAWEEARLLRAGFAYEQVAGWQDRHPPLA